ncbi:MAG: protein-glutamate O-methyltransferase family protein [Anaerolineales bacterium]|nr:protein-glutamate O-methyltransferase family protein [Anaerolineales bacterium]
MRIEKHPYLELPTPLKGTDKNTFTEHTLVTRMPEIGRRTISECGFPEKVLLKMKRVVESVPYQDVPLLPDKDSPDSDQWNAEISSLDKTTWLEAPWFFAETCYYRHLLSATGYFLPGAMFHRDPYHHQKSQAYATNLHAFQEFAKFFNSLLPERGNPLDLRELLIADLWGNMADLSINPIWGNKEIKPGKSRGELLIDQSEAMINFLFENAPLERMDIVLDNVGVELAADLMLVAYLLETQLVSKIILHHKVHPILVSDAIIPDTQKIVSDFLDDKSPDLQKIGQLIQKFLIQGHLELRDHFYWSSPRFFWDAPQALLNELERSSLIITKGDANYRRIVGDFHWPTTSSFQAILQYCPVPLLAIRVSKSELMVGLQPGEKEDLDKIDPAWLYNGTRGILQFSRSG